jgi:hypothetical protein
VHISQITLSFSSHICIETAKINHSDSGDEEARGLPNKCCNPFFYITKPKAIVTNEIYHVTVSTILDVNRMATRLEGEELEGEVRVFYYWLQYSWRYYQPKCHCFFPQHHGTLIIIAITCRYRSSSYGEIYAHGQYSLHSWLRPSFTHSQILCKGNYTMKSFTVQQTGSAYKQLVGFSVSELWLRCKHFCQQFAMCKNNIRGKHIYTITLCTFSALTWSLRYVELLTGYGGNSSNHTVFTICLLIYLFLSEVKRQNLFS